MPTIIAYQKFINIEVTRELRFPLDQQNSTLGTELATLDDGLTYVSLPDGAQLPAKQPAEIAASIKTVTLTPALIDAIKAASPHVRLINQHVNGQLNKEYSLTDEIAMLSGIQDLYLDHAAACQDWGNARLALLGLV